MFKRLHHSIFLLLKRIVHELIQVSALRFAALFLLVADLLAMVIVMAIDFLWDGRFNIELAFAAVVTPIPIGLFLVVIVTAMLDEIREEVAQRKLAEIELRESERRFSDLLGNVELISMMLDSEARITYCNEYLLRLTGWEREEIIGKNWFDIFVPPELNYLKDSFFDRLLANLPEAHHHENEILTRSGERLLIHWNNSVLRSADGDVIGTASIGEDITSHRRVMAELEYKNTILQTQQEASPDAILVVDEKALIISFNQQFIDMWCLSPQMVRTRLDAPVLQAVVEQVEDSEVFVARIQYLYEHRDEKSSEEIKLKDGRIIDRYSAPVNGANGKYYGRVWYFHNITERKKLEQDREQYLKFFVLSINPMCIADPYGCFKEVNPAFVELTGYPESELISKPFLDFVLPEDRQITLDEMKLQVEDRPTLHFNNRYQCKDGKVIYLSWMAYYDKQDGITYATAIDTTERIKAEESLRQLSLAVEQSPSSIIITDLDSKIEYVNAAFVTATGYSAEEAIGQTPRMLSSGNTQKEIYNDMWAHLGRGEVWKGELINRRKDGGEYIESAWISPVRQPDGSVTHYLSINEDITQYKQAEVALRSSRENLHRLLNSIAEGAYGLDTQGVCTFVNRAFLQMLGYENDAEVLGIHLHELIHYAHPDGSPYPANDCRTYRAYLSNQAINVSDEVFWRKDGVAIPVEYWSHPIVSDGAVIGAIVTFIDITERKKAVATLHEKEILLSESQRIAHIGSWRFELTGQLTWSEETYRIYGVSPETFIPNIETFTNLIHPSDRLAMQAWISNCMAGQKPGELEFRICPPDGSERAISGFGELQYDALGRPNHLIGIVHDITERKQNEIKLTEQLDELRRWHSVTSGREGRILDLKHEVNELLGQTGKQPRYPSAESQDLTQDSKKG